MRGPERRGTAGVECGGGVVTLLGATIGTTKKIEGKWGLGLRWPKLYGKMQQPAKSWR